MTAVVALRRTQGDSKQNGGTAKRGEMNDCARTRTKIRFKNLQQNTAGDERGAHCSSGCITKAYAVRETDPAQDHAQSVKNRCQYPRVLCLPAEVAATSGYCGMRSAREECCSSCHAGESPWGQCGILVSHTQYWKQAAHLSRRFPTQRLSIQHRKVEWCMRETSAGRALYGRPMHTAP